MLTMFAFSYDWFMVHNEGIDYNVTLVFIQKTFLIYPSVLTADCNMNIQRFAMINNKLLLMQYILNGAICMSSIQPGMLKTLQQHMKAKTR